MAIMEADLFRGVSQRFFMTRIANSAEEQSHKKNAVIFERGERISYKKTRAPYIMRSTNMSGR